MTIHSNFFITRQNFDRSTITHSNLLCRYPGPNDKQEEDENKGKQVMAVSITDYHDTDFQGNSFEPEIMLVLFIFQSQEAKKGLNCTESSLHNLQTPHGLILIPILE